jgi:hypothetical protein
MLNNTMNYEVLFMVFGIQGGAVSEWEEFVYVVAGVYSDIDTVLRPAFVAQEMMGGIEWVCGR